jgi:hypothetical protein
LLAQHGADQVLAEELRRAEQGASEQPVEDGRLPLDEGFVVQDQGGAAEDHDQGRG